MAKSKAKANKMNNIEKDETDCSDNCDCNELVEVTPIDNEKMHTVTRPSASSADEKSEASIVFVNAPSELEQIKNDTVQLVVWHQTNPSDFFTALSSDPSVLEENLPSFQGIVTSDDVYDKMRDHFGCRYRLRSKQQQTLTDAGIDELIRGVKDLVDVFSKISDSEIVYVKLEVVTDNGCVFWHQDCVDYRLVTTYRGPCTEWVPPNFSQKTLKRRRYNSEHAKSLSHCDVALFKGRGETPEGEAILGQPGIVHRSPRIPESSKMHRLVLTLDIPEEGWHY